MRVLEVLGPSTGGIRRHVALLAKLLASGGDEVVAAAPTGVLDGLDVGVAAVREVPVPTSFDPRRIVRAVRSMRRLIAETHPEVVHAHGLKAAWVAVLARPGVPVVLTVHNVVLDEVAGRSAALQRWLERRVVKQVDRVIAVSPEIVEHLGAGTFVLPASEAPVPRRERGEVRQGLGLGDDDPLVVCAARLHPQKDLPLLLRAWARLQDRAAWLLIVGDGPQRDELEALRSDLGLDRVLMPGASPHAVDELNAADLVVMSSRWEGAPLVIAEAMQLGKAIVSTRVGVVPDMIVGCGEVVEVGDEDALVAAIDRFLADDELRENCAKSALERGRVLYGAQRLVDEVRGVYVEVVAR